MNEALAIKAGWSRCDDSIYDVFWSRPVRTNEIGAGVKNRSEWRVVSATEALELDAAVTLC